MNIYGHRSRRLNVPGFLRRLRRRTASLPRIPDLDALVDLLVDLGEAHAGIADALMPWADDCCAALAPWTNGLAAVADAVCASWHDDREAVSVAFDRAQVTIACLADPPAVAADIDARTAEGFAYYSLYPEQYLVAAEQLIAGRNPKTLLCVGIRSIGSPLACLVAAAARRAKVTADVITVRPRGHPFDRRLAVTDRLRRHVSESRPDIAAIADEGPGLSGSSFAAAAEALVDLGIDSRRVVLLPSWSPPAAALGSARGRATWERHEKVVVPFERIWPAASYRDLSGGQWRSIVFGDQARWPAVQPHHERRKYLNAREDTVRRFAGLGRYGRDRFARGGLLASAGFTPQPLDLQRGFMTERWVAGTPLGSVAPPDLDEATLQRMADYVAFLRTHFATGRRARTDDLAEALDESAPPFDEPEIAVDGRMLPQEWIRTGGVLLKADALDHHGDDFMPGCRDAAWDIAGALVEFGLQPAAADYLVARYASTSGDRAIAMRLPFYRSAYLAYRAAYAELAAESLGDAADAHRFRAAASRYRRLLEAHAPRRRPPPRC